jgi:hypothetical protein
MSKSSYREKFESSSNVDPHTARSAGIFLFDTGRKPPNPKDGELDYYESKALDQRTRVIGSKTMGALTYLDTIHEHFNSKSALMIGNILKRLLIGHEGKGRSEAVQVLRQSLPKEIEVERGYEPALDDL